MSLKLTQTNKNKIELNKKTKSNKERSTLMVRACSELREALANVSSSTKTAFLRSSFWSDSRFEAISVRLVVAPLHLSLPLPFSSTAISLPALEKPSMHALLGFSWFSLGCSPLSSQTGWAYTGSGFWMRPQLPTHMTRNKMQVLMFYIQIKQEK
jgi:hypothetical protein